MTDRHELTIQQFDELNSTITQLKCEILTLRRKIRARDRVLKDARWDKCGVCSKYPGVYLTCSDCKAEMIERAMKEIDGKPIPVEDNVGIDIDSYADEDD